MTFDIEIVIRSTTVLVSATLGNAALRRASASARHSIWTIALAAALGVPILTNVVPPINLFLLSNSDLPQPRVTATPSATPSNTAAGHDPSFEILITPEPARSWHPSGLLTPPWILLVWLGGVLVVLIRSLLAIRDIRMLRRNSSAVEDAGWNDQLDELKKQISVHGPVGLRVGESAISPMAWGIVHSTILMPSAARTWTAERLRLVLAHELAHVKRRESWTQILIQAATAAYWFNPLVWYAAYRMRIERERACDDQVLNLGADAEDYADHLLAIARDVTSGWTAAAVSMVHPSNLESRLRALLDCNTSRRTLSLFATTVVAASAAVLATAVAATQLAALPFPPSVSAAMAAAPEPVHSIPSAAFPTPKAPSPQAQQASSFAMVIVLDKSGSMRGDKMNFAKQAARSALMLIQDDQWFGIVTFNAQSDWAVSLQQAKNRAAIDQAIEEIGADGETNIYPALQDAYQSLTRVPSTIRHVVLLTDGRSLPFNYPAMLDEMNKSKITLSTIAVGQGADRDFLVELAQLGHGRSYFVLPQASDPLAEIFRQEIRIAQQIHAAAVEPLERPRFEAVSIKPNKSGVVASSWGTTAVPNATPVGCHGMDRGPKTVPLGECIFHNVTAGMLFATFWNQPSNKISNVPSWVTADGFDIEAKAAAPVTQADLISMMQLALEDRFQLTFHRENRDVSGFTLVIASGGSKLKQADERETNGGVSGLFNRGAAGAKKASIEQLILFLGSGLGQPIADSTGLRGNYEFGLRWTPDSLATAVDLAVAAGPSLFTALQEQLGLRLESSKLSVEFAVIDHVERPTTN